LKISAFAKVNLYLDIIGKRSDGYHELVTLMCPIALSDTISLKFDTADISVSCNHPNVPEGPKNIAHTAARRFFRAFEGSRQPGVHIDIDKNIPVGAGLGGGSSNAAAVLTGLNQHFNSPLSRKCLIQIGKTLGSDVPFFLHDTPAIATGLGDIITPFQGLPPYPIVLIYPGYLLPTPDVYKNFKLGLTKLEKIHTKNIFKLDWRTNVDELLFNALETSAFELCPEIAAAKEKLMESGAAGALMTGSGSSVFGIYNDPETAERACRFLSQEPRWQVFHTRLLT
jgi:4-diphosphocytidyl-2-C-methyl-D-erythritol kinase